MDSTTAGISTRGCALDMPWAPFFWVRFVPPNPLVTGGVSATDHRPVVSVVFVSYRRVDLLELSLASFLSTAAYPRSQLELILCDDGSPAEMQERMRRMPFDKLLLDGKNRGVGANTNKGIKAAQGEYILQLQDDWLCVGGGDFIEACLELFTERPDVHLIRLRQPFDGPFEVHRTGCGRTAQIYRNRPQWRETAGEYLYSDNPHMKRRRLHEVLGPYTEQRPMHVTEMDFCRRLEAQAQMRVAFIEGYTSFVHLGQDRSFNPLLRRQRWIKPLEHCAATAWVVRGCRALKRAFRGWFRR